jgi:hypothetical protein
MDAADVGGGRNAAPASLIRVAADVKVDENVICRVDVWHLSDDMEEILAAEEFHPVDSLDEARRIAGNHGALHEGRCWVADGHRDPCSSLIENKSGGNLPTWGRHAERKFWVRSTLLEGAVPSERICEEATIAGELWHHTQVVTRGDVTAAQVCAKVSVNQLEFVWWLMHYQHVPGLEKRKAAARKRADKKKEGSVPSAIKLSRLLSAMSDLGSVTLYDGTVNLTVSFPFGGYRSIRSQAALKLLLPRMVQIQRALGNPWLLDPASVQAIKSALLHCEAMRASEDPFWQDLLVYLEEVEPLVKARKVLDAEE